MAIVEVQELWAVHKDVTFAYNRCQYGASQQRPFRIVTNLAGAESLGFAGPPLLRQEHRYAGPLPPYCGHEHSPEQSSGPRDDPVLFYEALFELLEAGRLRRGSLKLGVAHTAAPEEQAETPMRSPQRGRPIGGGRRLGPEEVYIGRSNRFGEAKWGNPFKVGEGRTPEQAVQQYREWFVRDPSRVASRAAVDGK